MNNSRAVSGRFLGLILVALGVSACSSSKPKLPELPAVTQAITAESSWSHSIGDGGGARLTPGVIQTDVVVAAGDGSVSRLNGATGAQRWSVRLKDRIVGGVAVGQGLVVVATAKAELVALADADGREIWKASVGAMVTDLPTISEEGVFVRANNNRVSAHDLKSGKRLWVLVRSIPNLQVHGVGGGAVSDGLLFLTQPEGRLLALALGNGAARWEATLGLGRGVNELERLSDVLRPVLMGAADVCVAAYRSRVGCFSTGAGRALWSHDLGATGLGGDARLLFVSDVQGRIHALERESGRTLWTQDQLKLRHPTAPVSYGRAVWVGDRLGVIHAFDRENGRPLARFSAGGEDLSVPPVIVGDRLIIQSPAGRVTAVRVGG